MRKMIQITMLKVSIILSLLFLNLTVSAVSREAALTKRAKDSTNASSNLRELYEFNVGRQLNYALMSGCPIYFGIIETVEGGTLALRVSEPLSRPTISETSIKVRVDRPLDKSDSPWASTDFKVGLQLLIAECDNRVRIAVSDESLFNSIRKVISFDQMLPDNPNLLTSIPSNLRQDKDYIFAGYAVDMLWRRNFAKDDQAAVLSKLLVGGDITTTGFGLARVKLRGLLVAEGERAISDHVRQTVLSNLISAVLTGKGSTDQIFTLFCELADKDKLELSLELNQSSRHIILEKFKQFRQKTGPCSGQQELEELLKAK